MQPWKPLALVLPLGLLAGLAGAWAVDPEILYQGAEAHEQDFAEMGSGQPQFSGSPYQAGAAQFEPYRPQEPSPHLPYGPGQDASADRGFYADDFREGDFRPGEFQHRGPSFGRADFYGAPDYRSDDRPDFRPQDRMQDSYAAQPTPRRATHAARAAERAGAAARDVLEAVDAGTGQLEPAEG